MENQVLTAIKERRSIRSFSDRQVEPEALSAILEAGTYAPTGMGWQTPIMVVVQKPELVKRISAMNAAVMGTNSDPFYGAPTIVIVFSDGNVTTGIEDGSLVLGNLMLAAHSVGVDSIWIHRARQEFETPEGKALMKSWGIPDSYIGIGHCALGYRNCEYPAAKPRKEGYIIYAE